MFVVGLSMSGSAVCLNKLLAFALKDNLLSVTKCDYDILF
jgi:hypothetical protein